MCPKDYIVEQLRLQREKERLRIERQQEEARAQLALAAKDKQLSALQKRASQQYRQIVIKLSDESSLLEEILNAERMESLNTQRCPKCNIKIEKNGGCSHMHCTRCDHHFTWQIVEKDNDPTNFTIMNSSDQNADHVESAKEELNKIANLGMPSISEI